MAQGTLTQMALLEGLSSTAISQDAGAGPRKQHRHMFKQGEITTDLEMPVEAWRKGLMTFSLALAGFMVRNNRKPALPTIVAQFHSVNDIGAYTSAYLLPQCVLQPLCNKLYSLFAFSTVYISSILMFCGGCLLCATSHSSAMFIGGRALSGVGSVGLSIGGFRMLALMPETKGQNLSMGVFSLVLGSSIVVGPIVGGVITQTIGWHWMFWINLPVLGLVLVCMVVAVLFEGPDLRGEKHHLPFADKMALLDWLGTAFLILTLIPIILGIKFGQTDGWGSAKATSLFVAGGAALVLLIMQQLSSTRDLIFEPRIILNRSVWSTAGLFFCALSSVAVLITFLPFLFQKERSVSPQTSGFLSFPLAGTLALGTFIFSIVSTLVSYFNPLAVLGSTFFLVANIMFIATITNSTSTSTIPQIVGYEVIAGTGLGMAWLAEIIFPRAALDKHQLATSLGYTRMLQQVGAAIAVQVAAAIFTRTLLSELSALPLGAEVIVALVHGSPGTDDSDSGSPLELPGWANEAVARAYGKAIKMAFIPATVFAALAFLFSLALPWTKLRGGVTERDSVGAVNSGREELDMEQNEAGPAPTSLGIQVPGNEGQEGASGVKNGAEKASAPGSEASELTLVGLAEEKRGRVGQSRRDSREEKASDDGLPEEEEEDESKEEEANDFGRLELRGKKQEQFRRRSL
ncbi:major facilitator superfamily domain-containing protein [Cercophora scortea]|uniref:Major facilitator superfamily domain-containing protein n=1 Tax=Cercophora scortea TaxID=314031 RepID=A0AAE0ILQ6_9PEZI|nr:major facilitator superfamily domain-containing protein [Cercophora scortea]